MMLLLLLFACSHSDLDSGELVDCAQDCGAPECAEDPACYEDCSDGLDNDGDGDVDCLDPDCLWQPRCSEDCEDGQDNDFDGLVDCLDPDCGPECPEDCEDGQDNDFDGFVDCDDHDCACPEDCSDGVDNDLDTRIDCQDSDCWGDEACDEDCSDGVDNDEDSLTDCQDPECRLYEDCIEDCWNSDCSGLVEPCIEICGDGLDNDEDGLLDCEDANCQFECDETSCTDGLDNNGNGRADCHDEQCWGLNGCEPALGIRVLTGHVDQATHYGSLPDPTMQGVQVSSASGLIHMGLESSNVACAWHADRLWLHYSLSIWQSHTWSSSTSRTVQRLELSGFDSTGACAPYIDPSALSFSTMDRKSYTHEVGFSPELSIAPGRVRLGEDLWLAGTPRRPKSSTSTYFSFQIDPLLTEPWVFSP